MMSTTLPSVPRRVDHSDKTVLLRAEIRIVPALVNEALTGEIACQPAPEAGPGEVLIQGTPHRHETRLNKP
jgi:hypothetical protein